MILYYVILYYIILYCGEIFTITGKPEAVRQAEAANTCIHDYYYDQ